MWPQVLAGGDVIYRPMILAEKIECGKIGVAVIRQPRTRLYIDCNDICV